MSNLILKKQEEMAEIATISEFLIPENNEGRQMFNRNVMFYLVKNKAVAKDDMLVVNGITIDKMEFVQKMYEATRSGLSLIDGDFSLVTFQGGEVVVMPNFRSEIRMAEAKGLQFNFIHGREGDTFEVLGTLQHKFDIKPRKGNFKNIQTKQVSTAKGGSYGVNEYENDVVWYAVECITPTGQRFSYVESTKNILLRANPKTLKFYKDPNAADTMFEKFVFRQLNKRLPSNLAIFDFDKTSNPSFDDVQDAEVVEEVQPQPQPAEPQQPKPTKKRLEIDDDNWKKMLKAISEGKQFTLEQVEKHYDMTDEVRQAVIEELFNVLPFPEV